VVSIAKTNHLTEQNPFLFLSMMQQEWILFSQVIGLCNTYHRSLILLRANLLADELMAGVDDLKHSIHLDALGVGVANTSKMSGVKDIISASNTIAGVAQGSNAWFASYINDPANDSGDDDTALTVALMDDVFQNMVDVRGATPDAIWTSFAQYNAYANLMSDKIRYIPYGTGGARFQALIYLCHQACIFFYHDATRMDFVQSGDWSLQYLPQKSYTAEGKLVG
jgi:hypothetical protein